MTTTNLKSSQSAVNYHIHIAPARGWVPLHFEELWEFRELLYFFIWRDIKVRYKQTVLGVAWAILQPILIMAVFSVFFGQLVGVPSDGIPYPIFSFTALVPWTFFSTGVTNAANSLVNNSNLIKKTYFPRLAVPLSTIIAGLVDFALALLVLIGMMIVYNIPVTVNILFLPLFISLAFATAAGVGLWLSAVNVRYRDVRHIVPFLTQFWMYATPILYPASLIKNETLRFVYGLNPMVGVVEGFRWALLGLDLPSIVPLGASILVSVALIISGLFYFRHTEQTFADVA
jgi:lipopolysaccharide transport system permease protein